METTIVNANREDASAEPGNRNGVKPVRVYLVVFFKRLDGRQPNESHFLEWSLVHLKMNPLREKPYKLMKDITLGYRFASRIQSARTASQDFNSMKLNSDATQYGLAFESHY